MEHLFQNRQSRRFYPNQTRIRAGASMLLSGLISLLLASTEAHATNEHCGVSFDSSAAYPLLPDLPGVDIAGSTTVWLFLQPQRGVVDIDGCLYELDRPLELDFGSARAITLSFELPELEPGTVVLVSSAGTLIEVLDASDGYFDYAMTTEASLEFSIVPIGSTAPTVPLVVTKPIEDDPEPA